MANNPKHGDEIIKVQKTGLGGEKLVATPQFQQFLDDLSNIEAFEATDADDVNQEIQVISGVVNAVQAKINELNRMIDSNIQLLSVIEMNMQKLNQQKRTMMVNVDDLEQLAHVN